MSRLSKLTFQGLDKNGRPKTATVEPERVFPCPACLAECASDQRRLHGLPPFVVHVEPHCETFSSLTAEAFLELVGKPCSSS